jgi:hypothetical protein
LNTVLRQTERCWLMFEMNIQIYEGVLFNCAISCLKAEQASLVQNGSHLNTRKVYECYIETNSKMFR